MSLEKINKIFSEQLTEKDNLGTTKRHELVVSAIKAASDGYGPRYLLAGHGDSLRRSNESISSGTLDRRFYPHLLPLGVSELLHRVGSAHNLSSEPPA